MTKHCFRCRTFHFIVKLLHKQSHCNLVGLGLVLVPSSKQKLIFIGNFLKLPKKLPDLLEHFQIKWGQICLVGTISQKTKSATALLATFATTEIQTLKSRMISM